VVYQIGVALCVLSRFIFEFFTCILEFSNCFQDGAVADQNNEQAYVTKNEDCQHRQDVYRESTSDTFTIRRWSVDYGGHFVVVF
jgi:hypothetical protein